MGHAAAVHQGTEDLQGPWLADDGAKGARRRVTSRYGCRSTRSFSSFPGLKNGRLAESS
jgi:hypothetical protein